MTEEYYTDMFRLIRDVREEMIDDLLATDDLEESLSLVSELKASSRLIDRLQINKGRVELKKTLTLAGDT